MIEALKERLSNNRVATINGHTAGVTMERQEAAVLTDSGSEMARIANELRAQSDDTEAVLRKMSKYAVDTLPGAEYATVTLVANGTIETPWLAYEVAAAIHELNAPGSLIPSWRIWPFLSSR